MNVISIYLVIYIYIYIYIYINIYCNNSISLVCGMLYSKHNGLCTDPYVTIRVTGIEYR